VTSSPRTRMIVGFALANVAIMLVAALVLLNRPQLPPTIQGVLLPDAREIPPFSLRDHNNRLFSNKDITGQWHLVSYGFTTCPDICPTTLAQLAQLEVLLKDGDINLQVVFYSVDHQRDTVEQLAKYMPFFHPDFLGLTHTDDGSDQHLAFEQGLGIVSQLILPTEESDPQPYQVVHGVTLFLLNPNGQLQAILKPGTDKHRNKVFDAATIYKDFLQVRAYFG
jgi:protein SCO1/2